MQMEIEVEALGQKQTVKCFTYPHAFVMDPESYFGEGMSNEQIAAKNHRVNHAQAEPGSKKVKFKSRNGTTFTYDPDVDPDNIVVDLALSNCRVISDVAVDGLYLSDWTYFTKQRQAVFNAVKRRAEEIGFPNPKYLARTASGFFSYLIKLQRGVNLDAKIPDAMLENDLDYDRRQRERAMRA